MKPSARILVALLALLIVGCQNPGGGGTDNTPKVGSLVGTVSGPQANSAEGAEVWLSNTKLQTVVDANGNYSLTNVPVGSHTLNVAKTGYGRETVTVAIAASAQTNQPDIELTPLTVDETITLTESSGSRSWGSSQLTSNLNSERLVTLNYTVPAGGRDVYYLLTNVNTAASSNFGGSVLAGNVAGPVARKGPPTDPKPVLKDYPGLVESGWRALAAVRSAGSGRALSAATSPVPPVLNELATTTFIDALWPEDVGPSAANNHPSTLRKVVDGVGGRRLHIWVSDAAWSDGYGPTIPSAGLTRGVTPTMVNQLADRFMHATEARIYDWVTDLYGEEWPLSGAPAGFDGKLIDGGGQVHIFLANLNPGGTADEVLMGYFHSLNNVVGYTGSNEKVLFALDASSLATPSGNDGWQITDYWPSEIVSTLAHEFQHMIHYNQKQVKHSTTTVQQPWTDTWINEMASLITEDLVADKLGVSGPRGVSGTDYTVGTSGNTAGRLPLFNLYHDVVTLTGWGTVDLLASYSNSYAFGAWLLRNHGGPQLFHDIVTGPETDYDAIVDAVNANNGADPDVTFASLVRDWGLATFLAESGNRVGLNYQSSGAGGAFDWTFGGQGYKVGSIDPWKYRIEYGDGYILNGPWLATDGVLNSSTWVAAGATYYHWAGRQDAATVTTQLTLPPGVVLTVLVQP